MITVSWLKHLAGQVVRILLDYVDHVTFCSKLKGAVMEQQQWPDICRLQGRAPCTVAGLDPGPVINEPPACLLHLQRTLAV